MNKITKATVQVQTLVIGGMPLQQTLSEVSANGMKFDIDTLHAAFIAL